MEDNYSEEIIQQYNAKLSEYESFCQYIEYLIEQLLQSEKINHYSLSKRVKTVESLKSKLIKKGDKYKALSDITDLAGIRIITHYSDQVDTVAKIIEQEFEVDEENTIDKRKMMDPDRFGYISLHYIIKLNADRKKLRENEHFKEFKAEIQIRTILQHAWADIEHDLGYKSKDTIPRNIQRDFNRLSGLLELADKEFLGIRNSLSAYKDYVSSNINKYNEEILLDKISLVEFINTNRQLKQLSQQIADICGSYLLIEDYSIEGDLKYLQLLKIKTIRELNTALLEDKDLAYYIAQVILSNIEPPKFLFMTIGLFYLFYARISKIKEKNEIYTILSKTNISYGSDDERWNFVDKLIELNKSFQKNE
jgi:ppGpp synthetase/RelA/SpoT-type nucleotidyltranferase